MAPPEASALLSITILLTSGYNVGRGGGQLQGGCAGLLGSLYRTSRGSGKEVLLQVVDVGRKGGGSTKKLPVFGVL